MSVRWGVPQKLKEAERESEGGGGGTGIMYAPSRSSATHPPTHPDPVYYRLSGP